VICFRPLSVFALSAAVALSAHGTGIAQSLSDAPSATRSDWSNGYMGLGGNLGQAIERHHSQRAQPSKSAKASRSEHRGARQQRARMQPAAYKPVVYRSSADAPVYLIAQSLDHSGLTINTLRLQKIP